MRYQSSTMGVLLLLTAGPVSAQSHRSGGSWPRATPAAIGLDPAVLSQLDADFKAGKYGYVDGMLIIRHGKLVYDRSYPHDYDSLYRSEARTAGALNAHDPFGATQLLSHIFRVAPGRDIEENASQYLFAPFGIERWFWKRTPTGLPDTEGGLYLEIHDLAKIPYLFLKNGVWTGKRLVPTAWVAASVTPAVSVTESRGAAGDVQYGLLWWLYSDRGSDRPYAWAGSGFGGQRPIVFPEYDLVAVFTGWNVLPDRPALSRQAALEQVLAAVQDRRSSAASKSPK